MNRKTRSETKVERKKREKVSKAGVFFEQSKEGAKGLAQDHRTRAHDRIQGLDRIKFETKQMGI